MSTASVALSEAEKNIVDVLTKEQRKVPYRKWSEYLRKLGFHDLEIDKYRDNGDFSGLACYWCKHVGPNTDSKIFRSIRKEVLGQEVSSENLFASIKFTKLRKRRNRALFVYELIRSYDIANWTELVRKKLGKGDKLPDYAYDYKNDIEEQKYRVCICWFDENNFKTTHSAVKELQKRGVPIIPKETTMEPWCTDSEQESESTEENQAELSIDKHKRFKPSSNENKTAHISVTYTLDGDDIKSAKILFPQQYSISQVDSILKFKHSNIVRSYGISFTEQEKRKLNEDDFNNRFLLKGEPFYNNQLFVNVYIIYKKSDETKKPLCAKIINKNICEHINEKRLLLDLKDSNVVHYYGLWSMDSDQSYALVMELCWTTVEDYLKKPKNWIDIENGEKVTDGTDIRDILPISHLEILKQSTLGLQYLHSHDIIHRNIKPSNFFVTKKAGKAIVKIGDFGISLKRKNKKTSSAKITVCGTAMYIPPEGFEIDENMDYLKKIITLSYDIFSFGIMWYFVLTNGQGQCKAS